MAKKSDGSGLLQVKTSFTALFKGTEVTYREGEAVHPDDPLLARYPEHFEPLAFPHDPAAMAELPEPEPEPAPEPEPEPGSGEDDGSPLAPEPVEV